MPSYRTPVKLACRSVRSVLQQTYRNFSLFVVFDGEQCPELTSYLHSDPRIRSAVLPAHMGGAGWACRNYAIEHSDSRWIAYLDDDNWWEPDHLERSVALMKCGLDMTYTGSRIWLGGRAHVERIHVGPPAAGNIDTSEIVHRRGLIAEHGGWRLVKKCCDWDLVSRWGGCRWGHTGVVTANYRLKGSGRVV